MHNKLSSSDTRFHHLLKAQHQSLLYKPVITITSGICSKLLVSELFTWEIIKYVFLYNLCYGQFFSSKIQQHMKIAIHKTVHGKSLS